MKRFRIVMGALAIVIVAVVIIACKKEKSMSSEAVENIEMISKEDDMNAYLKQFKERMQSASRGDETLSIEDARWHLEAVLNYTYGDAGHPFSDIQCDTFYYKLPAQNEGITFAQLNQAFIEFSESVEEAYAYCSLPGKSVLAIQTKFERENKDVDISVQSILSIGGSINTINMWFDYTDYWNERYYDYGGGDIDAGGKCGPYLGEHPESGAPLELTRKLNLRIPVDVCPQDNAYYTDIAQIVLNPHNFFNYYPYDDFVYDEDSPCHYKIYYRNEDPHEPWASNPGGCICPEDMNYYLSKGLELINHYCPSGKVVIGAYYRSNVMVGIGSRDDNCFHELVLDYGVLHCTGGGNDY